MRPPISGANTQKRVSNQQTTSTVNPNSNTNGIVEQAFNSIKKNSGNENISVANRID